MYTGTVAGFTACCTPSKWHTYVRKPGVTSPWRKPRHFAVCQSYSICEASFRKANCFLINSSYEIEGKSQAELKIWHVHHQTAQSRRLLAFYQTRKPPSKSMFGNAPSLQRLQRHPSPPGGSTTLGHPLESEVSASGKPALLL